MSGVLRWQEPPPDQRGHARRENHDLDSAASDLLGRPGDWGIVLVAESHGAASGQAAHIRTGRIRAFRPGGTFAAVVRVVDGEHRVYARYVGGEQ